MESTETTKMILRFPREVKLQCLRDALQEGAIGQFFTLSKVLLDAPINEGGIESEVIDEIHQEYLQKKDV